MRNKLLMLLAPFLKRWTYTRAHEQVRICHARVTPAHGVQLCSSFFKDQATTRVLQVHVGTLDCMHMFTAVCCRLLAGTSTAPHVQM